jgi:hypothetical protein
MRIGVPVENLTENFPKSGAIALLLNGVKVNWIKKDRVDQKQGKMYIKYVFMLQCRKVRDLFGDLDINVSIILKWI